MNHSSQLNECCSVWQSDKTLSVLLSFVNYSPVNIISFPERWQLSLVMLTLQKQLEKAMRLFHSRTITDRIETVIRFIGELLHPSITHGNLNCDTVGLLLALFIFITFLFIYLINILFLFHINLFLLLTLAWYNCLCVLCVCFKCHTTGLF